MLKLKKADFNKQYRFRESRTSLVSCVTCDNMAGGKNTEEGPAFCEQEERFRRIKIAEYWGKEFGSGASHNIALKRLCDAFTSKPLSERVGRPVLSEKQAILLGTQFRDPYHADPNCPYVIEELRMIEEKSNNKAEVSLIDLSEKVPGEGIRAICEMPCCESKLPFQISIREDYRQRVGIKPDGTEAKIWVRNGIIKHETKGAMDLEEAQAVFDLEKFDSSEFKGLHNRIIAASNHLGLHCNRLGSRPLSEASNPVWLDYRYHILEDPSVGPDTFVDVWVYDERLFDIAKGLGKPIKELEQIPEGLIPCMDARGVFRSAQSHCKKYSGRFGIYGIVRKQNNEDLLSRGARHFIEIGAVSYHGGSHMWGEFGKGFNGLASFHEE